MSMRGRVGQMVVEPLARLGAITLAAFVVVACGEAASNNDTSSDETTGMEGQAETSGDTGTDAGDGTGDGTTSASGDGDGDGDGDGETQGATGDGDGGGDLGPEVSIISYNLYGWNALIQNPWKGDNMMALLNGYAPDFVSAQEVEGQGAWILDQLQGNYASAGAELHGLAIFYDDDTWDLLDTGIVYLDEMDQWGQRISRWGYFEHEASARRLYVFDTHWCVCSGMQLLGSATTVVDAIVARDDPSAPVLFNGDLNVFEGLEDSLAVQYLKGGLGSPVTMVDTFRVVEPDAWGSTFGAAGKIDYVFATTDLEVLAASIDRETITPGEGSDHDPVLATVRLP